MAPNIKVILLSITNSTTREFKSDKYYTLIIEKGKFKIFIFILIIMSILSHLNAYSVVQYVNLAPTTLPLSLASLVTQGDELFAY